MLPVPLAIAVVLLGAPATSAEAKHQWSDPTDYCYDFFESCLGTDVQCAFFFDKTPENYTSQDACFDDRLERDRNRPLLQWHLPADDKVWHQQRCRLKNDWCIGTDATCGKIVNDARRAGCFNARSKGPWLQPNSTQCGKGWETEECDGTVKWCKKKAKLYGSESACLEKRLAFHNVYSPSCDGSVSEPCMGTKAWCERPEEIEANGSREKCVMRRGPPPLGLTKWLARDETCPARAREEKCVGTELACMSYVQPSLSQDCLATREWAPWYLVDGTAAGQVHDASATEKDVGTVVWCEQKWQRLKYANSAACFAARGPRPGNQTADLFSLVKAGIKKNVRDTAASLALTVAIQMVMKENATANATIKAIEDGLPLFLNASRPVVMGTIDEVVQGLESSSKALAST
ncbi:hypothetical protein DCS_03023 [Drechmeria coniospora]|uniref:Uncharacterized protein n=1 Tax=Drechmeria coniospora TaxID=98403 RepID=A0A151GXP7_DRECN|nr:hypothetical protein DCS_03023 [Drechmeria coniospora]KYK61879.1 hypothetical protein DCS_03023 [Drechmeria coniospora]